MNFTSRVFKSKKLPTNSFTNFMRPRLVLLLFDRKKKNLYNPNRNYWTKLPSDGHLGISLELGHKHKLSRDWMFRFWVKM